MSALEDTTDPNARLAYSAYLAAGGRPPPLALGAPDPARLAQAISDYGSRNIPGQPWPGFAAPPTPYTRADQAFGSAPDFSPGFRSPLGQPNDRDASPWLITHAYAAPGDAAPTGQPDQAPGLTSGPQTAAGGSSPPSAGGGSPPANPKPYDTWTLPNGQVVVEYDNLQGQNVTWHHGALGEVPGVFIDNFTNPDARQIDFEPTGPSALQNELGYIRSPEISASGSPYYDKVAWQSGPTQALLRLDAQGHVVKVFALDTGEAKEAPNPIDYAGPGDVKLALDLAAASAIKLGAPALLKGIGGAKLLAGAFGRAATEGGLEGPVVFRNLPDATEQEVAELKAYVDGSNEALNAGRLSPIGRVGTAGGLRSEANAAASNERALAAAQGRPYQGQVGHVPDTTWTGDPAPYRWMDLSPRVNASLGGQAGAYPVGYKPTVFKIGDE